MKFANLLKTSFLKEKPALVFLLKLLILSGLVKCVFFFYNASIASGWAVTTVPNVVQLMKWSVYYDAVCLLAINFFLLITILLTRKWCNKGTVTVSIAVLFALLNIFYFLLNGIDIFYYRFHLQRADADLLYVFRNPFAYNSGKLSVTIIAIILLSALSFFYLYKLIRRLINNSSSGYLLTNIVVLLCFSIIALSFRKTLVPTYPLTSINPAQLPLVQNSLHTFAYSLYRRNELVLPLTKYLPLAQQEKSFSIRKKNHSQPIAPKNIVLFIMESVPAEFFNNNSAYKVAMPFLDSLVANSTFYNNAFSYAYSSNKGITAMLAGIPTLTDIPLYHSVFTSIQHTAVGTELAKKGYHSAFFIGDNYDDFGFAQFCRWGGIERYYSMENIPGYQQMERHTMGLQDEYVLPFFQQQLDKTTEPFFGIQYNISTHFPHDIATNFKDRFPRQNSTPQMKTMAYYNDCLQRFFQQAQSKSWYRNTVFIFCSDHWAQPHEKNIPIDALGSFRIPIFIYEPSNPVKKRVNETVSQLDIMNTILYYGGYQDSITSYGVNLQNNKLDSNRTIFTKTNTAIYQAINQRYLLGFDAVEGKAVYCYDYKTDVEKKVNLIHQPHFSGADDIIVEMKAFLQTAVHHYKNLR